MKSTIFWRIGRGAAIGLATVSLSLPSGAESLSGYLEIQVDIGAGCQVDSGGTGPTGYDFGTLNFGQYLQMPGVIDASTIGTGGIDITCSNAVSYSISIDNGQFHNGSSRRLYSGGADYIEYELYQDAGRTTTWGTGGDALSAVSDGNPASYAVYGRVPINPVSMPSDGHYVDTVGVTVNW